MFKKGMIRFRRKMAAVLAAAMLFSSYPVPAYAAGDPEGDLEYTVVEEGQDDGLVSGDEADAVSEDEAVSVSDGEADAASENETEVAEEDVASENETASGSKKDDTFVESEIPTVVTDNFELVGNAQGGSGLEATELYFSDFSSTTKAGSVPARYVLFKPGAEIPADTYFFNGEWESGCLVSSNEVVFNGFTIYDDYPVYGDRRDDSANKIIVKKNISETINISSASKNEVTAYARFEDKGTLFKHTGIKFETTDYSEVSIVAKSSNNQNCNVYLKVGDGDVQEKAAGTDESSIVTFEAGANKTCYLSADPGVCIYYVKVTPGESGQGAASANKIWDFSKDETFGENKKIEEGIVSLNGLIVDATSGKFIKYDREDYVAFYVGSKLYVPVYENSVVRITGAECDEHSTCIKINGGEVNFAGEFTFECVEGNEKAGYVCIESCWNNKHDNYNYIEKLEIMDSHTVSFNALGENVRTAFFGDRLWSDDKAVALAVEAAVNAAPAGKVFAGWSETENGEAFVFNISISENKTFYAIYEDASNGELLFSNINNLTSDGKLKYRFAVVNGFTIYDKTDSQNSIRINTDNTESTGVASASVSAAAAYYTSGHNAMGGGETSIAFKTVEDSDIVVVAKRYNKDESKKVYFSSIITGDSHITKIEEEIPVSGESGVNKASALIFQAKADSLCRIYVDKETEVYFVKVMPRSQAGSWNFTTGNPFGSIGDEISGTTAYIDGLYVDTTADGARISKNNNIDDGINLTQGTVIYIPISGNKALSVDASRTDIINVNNYYFKNEMVVDSCAEKPGYVKLKVWTDSVNLKKIEMIDAYTVSFNVAGKDVYSELVGRGHTISSGRVREINNRARQTAGISENKTIGWWSLTPDGAAYDFENTPITADMNFYGVIKDRKIVRATFKVVNGSWDDLMYTSSNRYADIEGYVDGAFKLITDDIPEVGLRPDEGFTSGSWDVTPVAGMVITGDTTFTYTYAAKPAASVTTAPMAKTLSYNGLSQNLITAGTANTSMEYSINGTDYSTGIPTGKNAGTYTVYYRAKADANHSPSQAEQLTVNIAKAKLTVTAKSKSITYGDAPANYDVTYSGYVNGESYEVLIGSLEYDCSYTQYGNVGSYRINLGGLSADNYDIIFVPGTLTVVQKAVTVSGISANNKVYDGNTSVSFNNAAAVINGKITGDGLTVTASGNFADANVGTDKAVTISGWILDGASKDNYKVDETGSQTTATADITARPVTIRALDQRVEIGKSIASGVDKVSVTAGSLVSGHSIASISLNSTSTDAITSAGSISVSEAVIKNGTVDVTANYNITYAEGVLTVTKLKALITSDPVPAANLVYNGTAHNLMASAGTAQTSVEFSLDGTTYSDAIPTGTGAASYTVYYRAKGSDSYETGDAKSVTVSIARASASVRADDKTKTVGTADPALTASVSGVYGSDSISYTVNRAAGESVGTYVITATGGSIQGNYNVSYANGTFTIIANRITPSVSLSQLCYTYDGTEKKPAVTVKDGETVLASTDYTVTYANNINAGTADVTVSAAEGSNYSFDTVVLHFTIEKAAIKPSVSINGWTFGEEAQKPEVSGNTGNGAVAYTYKVKDADDSTYSAEVPSAVGSYTVKAEIAETANYLAGSATADFEISKKEQVSTELKFVFEEENPEPVYTGSAITPRVLGYSGDKLLTENVDYTVKYRKNVNAGTAEAQVSGKGAFDGEATLSFNIVPKSISGQNGAPADDIVVTGLIVKGNDQVKPQLIYNGKTVATGEYECEVSEKADGAETVTITAKGINFTGSIENLEVTRVKDKKELKKTQINVKLSKVSRTYDGTPQLIAEELSVTGNDGNTLTEGTDYVVSYPADVINVGTVKVNIAGIGQYTGNVSKSYKIEPAKNAAISVNLVQEEGMAANTYSFKKTGVTPAVIVEAAVNGYTYTLEEGRDFTVVYSNNKKTGTNAIAKINLCGNYKGVKQQKVTFSIDKASLEDADIFLGDMIYKKKGTYKSKCVISFDGEVLAAGEYKVTYSDAGKVTLAENETEKIITVTIASKKKNLKEGTVTAAYRVYKDDKVTDVSKAKVKLVVKGGQKNISGVGYTGAPITFDPEDENRQADISVKIGKTTLYGAEVFKYFDVSYADNVRKGSATIILTAKDTEGNPYSGMCSGKFSIVKKKIK